eukprot:2489199-Rhodomonas_salina.1
MVSWFRTKLAQRTRRNAGGGGEEERERGREGGRGRALSGVVQRLFSGICVSVCVYVCVCARACVPDAVLPDARKVTQLSGVMILHDLRGAAVSYTHLRAHETEADL